MNGSRPAFTNRWTVDFDRAINLAASDMLRYRTSTYCRPFFMITAILALETGPVRCELNLKIAPSNFSMSVFLLTFNLLHVLQNRGYRRKKRQNN